MTQFSLIFLAISVVIASTFECVRHLRKRRGNPFTRQPARRLKQMGNTLSRGPSLRKEACRVSLYDHDKERALLRETLKGMQ